MQNFFARRDPWGNGLALWVFVGMLFAAPLILAALKGIHLDNSVENWLPKDDPEAQIYAWYKDHFPIQNRILVTWDSSSVADPRVDQFVEMLIGAVDVDGVRRGGIPQVAAVVTPQHVHAKIVECDVPSAEAFDRLRGTLIGDGHLRMRLTPTGRKYLDETLTQLREQTSAELGLTLSITPAVESSMLGDAEHDFESAPPHAVVDGVPAADAPLGTLMGEIPPHDLQVAWDGLHSRPQVITQFRTLALGLRGPPLAGELQGASLVEDCFLVAGSPVGLLVTLTEAGVADPETTLASITAAANSLGIRDSELRMAGEAVTGVALNEEIKKASWNTTVPRFAIHQRSPMLLSGAVGIILAFVFLKSLRLGLLVLAVSYYTTAISIAFIPLSGSSMNMVLMVMPTLLNVLTLSGAIHVANYWKHAAHKDPRSAITRATEMARQPCALASLTTAIGLISLLTSNLVPVRQFGLYSAIGSLISLVMVLYALPALLQLWRTSPPSAQDVDAANWRRFARLIARHSTATSVISLSLAIAATWGLTRFQTETKVIRYFPPQSRIVKDTRAIEQGLSGTASVEVVVRFDSQSQESLRFLERMEIVREVESAIKSHPEISGTLSLADFQPVTAVPADDATTFQKIRYNKRSSETERRVKSEEIDSRAFLVQATDAKHVAIPGHTSLNAIGDELWRITAQASVLSDVDYMRLTDELNERVAAVTAQHAGADHVVTGTVPLFLRTQQAVLESLIRSFGLAFGIIAVVMIVLLRNPLAGLISMLPNLVPIGTVFGLVSWFDFRVDVGSMVTASVALGIAVDGTLHLLTWFRDGINEGHSREDAMVRALAHCGPAMWQTSAAIGIGLLMLYPAELLMISRFGWLMSALIAAALLGDIVLLPALMVGPLGWLMERSAARTRSQTAESAPAPSASPIDLESVQSLQPHFDRRARRSLDHKLPR